MAEVSLHWSSLINTAICTITIILFITTSSTRAGRIPNMQLWNNPCSQQPQHMTQSTTTRHTRSAAENQLNYFINTLTSDTIKELRSLYPKSSKRMRSNCPKLNQLIRPIKSSQDLLEAYQSFYIAMMELTVYLDSLQNIIIRTEAPFSYSKRNAIFQQTKDNLKLTICEFNQTMNYDLNVTTNVIKPKMLNKIFKKKKQRACLIKEADISRVQMLDIQFFMKLKKFFREGKRILRGKKKEWKENGRRFNLNGNQKSKPNRRKDE